MNIRYSTEKICAICFGSYDESSEHDAVRLNCLHAFGRKCIIQWALESKICPVCGLETVPAEVREGACVYRRLANRNIFGLNQEQTIGLAFGFILAVYVGALISIDLKVHPDTPIGNCVVSLLVAAVSFACFGAFSRGRDPGSIFFRTGLLGSAVGLGFSALVISIATTFTE